MCVSVLRPSRFFFFFFLKKKRAYEISTRDWSSDVCSSDLVDDAIDLVRVAGTSEARDEHAHAGEHRADEDDDDEHDLPADADRRVAHVADEVTDHGVVADALPPRNHVLQHRRPRELSHGRGDRTFDERPVVPRSLDGFGCHGSFAASLLHDESVAGCPRPQSWRLCRSCADYFGAPIWRPPSR